MGRGDCRLGIDNLCLCGADGGIACRLLSLCGGHRSLCALLGCPVVVENLLGSGVVRGKLLGAHQRALGSIQFGFALRDDGGRGRSFGFALRDQAVGCLHANYGALRLRFGLPALSLELRGVHASEHVASLDEIALTDKDFLDPPRCSRRHVDLDRLNTTVSPGYAFRQIAIPGLLPCIITARAKSD